MVLPLIALLVSGDTNLVQAAQKILDSKYYAFAVMVIANQECKALDEARTLGFDHYLLTAEKEIEQQLDAHAPALVLCAGYNQQLSSVFVEKYRGRLVNFHPSLLPAFAGLFDVAVHAAVLGRGCRISGVTVHFIDADLDTGKILFQLPVAVDEFDSPESLKKKVQGVAAELLPKVIALAIDGKLQRLLA